MDIKNTPSESIKILEGMDIGISPQNLVYNAQEGNITAVKHLINAGIDINSISNEGNYAITSAARMGRMDIVKFLCEKGANIEVLTSSGRGALYEASVNQQLSIVKFLLEKGINPNGVEGQKFAPIVGAIQSKNTELIKLLVDSGADINIKSEDGVSLTYSTYHSISEAMYDLLVSLGATPLTEEEKKKDSFLEKTTRIIKAVYAKNAYIFLGINLFCFIIIFFVLDEESGGGFFTRIFTFLFCTILGGLIGIWQARNKEDFNAVFVTGFRRGAGILLVFFTLLSWSNSGYERSTSSTYSSSSGSHECSECGSSYSHAGWSTAGGEQFKHSKYPGYDEYCSKSCAYESQPRKWR